MPFIAHGSCKTEYQFAGCRHGLLLQSLCISSVHGGHKSGMTVNFELARHPVSLVFPAQAGIHAASLIPQRCWMPAWIAPAILMHFLRPWRSQVRHDGEFRADSSSRFTRLPGAGRDPCGVMSTTTLLVRDQFWPDALHHFYECDMFYSDEM